MKLELATLKNLWPHGDAKVPGLIEGICDASEEVFFRFQFDSPLVVAHAMAQFSHECGAGLEMVENINYSPEVACKTWPTRFSSPAQCYAKSDSWPGDPNFHVKLIDHVYGGRMGNAPYPSHDGSRNIGRGLSQVTGADGYRRLENIVHLDLLSNQDEVCEPENALLCGVADFVACGCLPYARRNSLSAVTHALNGGYIGLSERTAWFHRWMPALTIGNVSPVKVLHDDDADKVMRFQRGLIAEGFDPGVPDGVIGIKTIRAFQLSRGLSPDGVIGSETRPLLNEALSA